MADHFEPGDTAICIDNKDLENILEKDKSYVVTFTETCRCGTKLLGVGIPVGILGHGNRVVISVCRRCKHEFAVSTDLLFGSIRFKKPDELTADDLAMVDELLKEVMEPQYVEL